MQLSGLLGAERKIAAISRPHGVVGRRQLLDAGISATVIKNRVEAGWLRPRHRGVYLVGPVQSEDAPAMAAVLACGEGAVLSHRSAAALLRLLPGERHGLLEVTVPAGRSVRRPGIRVHRAVRLCADEIRRLRRIPVTTPSRTLLDVAAQVSARELEQALAQAERRHLVTRNKLLALLARYPRRSGAPALRRLLERSEQPALTRSKAEKMFLALVRRAGLPEPDVNVLVGPYELDFFWRDQQLAVEVDSFEFHGDRSAFEVDRRRDAELAARGVQVIRVTWRQIVDEPEATVARVAQALARRR